MNQQAIRLNNTQARQKFSHDCAFLSSQIVQLQTSNQLLSSKLDALLNQRIRLLDRLKELVAR